MKICAELSIRASGFAREAIPMMVKRRRNKSIGIESGIVDRRYEPELVSRLRAFQLGPYFSYSLSQGVVLDAIETEEYAAAGSTSVVRDPRPANDRVSGASLLSFSLDPLHAERPRD